MAKVILTDAQRREKFGALFEEDSKDDIAWSQPHGKRMKDNPNYHAERSKEYRKRIKEEKLYARFSRILGSEYGLVHFLRGNKGTIKIEISYVEGGDSK